MIAGLLCCRAVAIGQSTGDVIRQQAGEGVKQGAAVATEQAANNVSNKLINKLFAKKSKAGRIDSSKIAVSGGAPPTGIASVTASGTGAATGAGTTPDAFKTYSKFDFIPGDKILAVEDFSQDAIGDFPDKWNTNSTGEVQTIEGKDGKWLSVTKRGIFLPEFITALPENFTLQVDMICSNPFTGPSGNFVISFDVIPDPGKQFTKLGWGVPRNEARVWFQPAERAGSSLTGFAVFADDNQTMTNEIGQADWLGRTQGKQAVRISIWRQRQRLRVYMNEEKVWDIPRAFGTGKNYNTVLFSLADDVSRNDRYLFSNIRLAVGAPDTRNKLITEGKFSTTGILFEVNSAVVKGESYGTLQDIAAVLKDNPAIKVMIVGHTDGDGDAAQNLTLSRKRADAVKDALIKEFGIDASRLQTDGKGASQPVAPNTTVTGKAQNRRVEFIRL